MNKTANQSAQQLDIRRRRVSFRAKHRGMREMDFILGRFADDHLAQMDEAGLDRLEAFMDVDDQTLYRWISGALQAPPEFDGDILAHLQQIKFIQSDFT